MKRINSRSWLFGGRIDLLFLYAPVWLVWLICFLLPDQIVHQDIPIWVWLIIVVGIDVSHVWSTIFRTYTDKEEFKAHKKLLLTAPVLTFLFFFLISGYSQSVFWTILAYIALYHFIKQQYGFMRIYKAKGQDFGKKYIKDEWVIYLSMLYPVLYWHLSPHREFSWFVTGDFFNYFSSFSHIDLSTLFVYLSSVYWLLILLWVVQEFLMKQELLLGKVLWVLTTAINWYLGIVYFNSDLVFTLTNVVAHGIPYLALVFYYVERKKSLQRVESTDRRNLRSGFISVLLMLLVVFILAFGEEYLWDMWIYRENTSLFERFLPFSMEAFENRWLQAFGIALLTVPQATHYVVDGFIWKSGEKNPHLKEILLNE